MKLKIAVCGRAFRSNPSLTNLNGSSRKSMATCEVILQPLTAERGGRRGNG